MQGWIEGFQESIDFIERNLTDELDIEVIAAKAALSPFYYQRIFGALCGVTVGEYIRARRMTLAAQELSRKDMKVIDVAVKYGYDSPDSFTKAFQKFHGITPSQARESGASLRSFAPLHIKITMEGGTMLDYRIVEKAPFTIVGVKRPFNSETSYQEIPKFWDEWLAQGEDRSIKGTFGVCLDMRGKDFDYWIADLYFPWEDIPEGCETRVIPGSYWAQFPCKMSNLQDVNTKIWSEWLPALQGYKLMGEYDIEVYLPPEEGSEEMSVYIWVPLKKD
ncbi:MAG: AraC family transcriptional regulator [Butyrivibrio sp.]|jgi:AraC family transcriptional regulator|uniref:AraC family transcriptional regulator n=2 Tax=unclassified Butyrivibrio TaxID=2639466 RepID=UPI001EC6F157|nr:helix-turn-helix domain-containing protein [Butyrivibrio sp.]MBE5842074.1 AraC family transcriptional regulator [Butyrivibrio sp.]